MRALSPTNCYLLNNLGLAQRGLQSGEFVREELLAENGHIFLDATSC